MKTQYDNLVKKYNDHMKIRKKKDAEDIIELLGLTDKKIKVFELGCGTGLDAKYLLEKYKEIQKYYGIDNSNKMLSIFNKTVHDKRVNVIQADFDNYDIKKGYFDLIFGKYSVHYTQNITRLMKVVYKGLKKGGIFLFRDVHPFVGFLRKESKLYNVKEVVKFPISGGGKVYVAHPTFTLDEYINAILNAGFKIIRFVEEMRSQSKILGINGFEIPTRVFFILKKC